VNARPGALILAALFAMSAAPTARAEEAPSTEAVTSGALFIAVSADDTEAASLEASVRELLSRLGVAVEISRAERLDLDDPSLARPAPDRLATAWIDLRSQRARVVLVDRSGRLVARRDVARDRSSAIVVEEIAHIVQSSVEELADAERAHRVEASASGADKGGASGAPPALVSVASPPAPAERPPPTPERRELGLDAGGFFAGRAFGTGAEAVVGGGGLVGGTLGQGPLRPALWVLGSYHVAFDVRGRFLDIHTKAATLRLAPTVRLFGGPRWRLEVGPTIGVDIFWTTPRANSSGVLEKRLAGDSTDASPTVGALAAVHFAVGPTADLFAALAADADIAPHRFVVLVGQQAEPLFEQWRVRPALLAGFTFNLAGATPYPPAQARP
jgi:hypothetical protein